jgi:diguanylate cyclase (GGDEF)-like protein
MDDAGEPLGMERAVVFEHVDEAVDAVLAHLEAAGVGRWELCASADPRAPGASSHIVIDLSDELIDLSEDTRVLTLQPVEGSPVACLSQSALAQVESAARLVATLLATADRAAKLGERVEQAERESTTDALTGLPNARAWWRILAREGDRCDRYGLEALVAVVDLDNLKVVNDRDGHLAGDELIRRAARVLARSVRNTDVVARLGGDEFGVLVVDSEPSAPPDFTIEIRDRLEHEGVLASVGTCLYTSDRPINDSFHQADLAMYQDKRLRRSRIKGASEGDMG